jgi:hypothetical protein
MGKSSLAPLCQVNILAEGGGKDRQVPTPTRAAVKLISEYLEQSVNFAELPSKETDPEFRGALLRQAAAYRS